MGYKVCQVFITCVKTPIRVPDQETKIAKSFNNGVLSQQENIKQTIHFQGLKVSPSSGVEYSMDLARLKMPWSPQLFEKWCCCISQAFTQITIWMFI